MQTIRKSPDISVMWHGDISAGAGYIQQVAEKALNMTFCDFSFQQQQPHMNTN